MDVSSVIEGEASEEDLKVGFFFSDRGSWTLSLKRRILVSHITILD
jgi:hypothetical protein